MTNMLDYKWYKIGTGKKFHLIPIYYINRRGAFATLCDISGIPTGQDDGPRAEDRCKNCLKVKSGIDNLRPLATINPKLLMRS
jgi:hypothetical protein